MPRLHKHLGKNAAIAVKWSQVRPLDRVKEVHPNDYTTTRGEFTVVALEESSSFDGKQIPCLVITSSELPGVALRCKAGAGSLVCKAPPNQVFVRSTPDAGAQKPGAGAAGAGPPNDPSAGENVDGEEDPESEEPSVPQPTEIGDVIWQQFKDDILIDKRSQAGCDRRRARLRGVGAEDMLYMSPFAMLRKMLPMHYISNHLIAGTNKELGKINAKLLKLTEFWLWLALHFVISMNPAYHRDVFFPGKNVTCTGTHHILVNT